MNFDAIIKRILHIPDVAMFGVFIWKDFPICVTLELPWRNNLPFTSCIPSSSYEAERVDSPNHGNTFRLKNVPGRSNILFHGANTVADLLGCIGMAEFYHRFDGQFGIANPSKGAAMIEFRQVTHGLTKFTVDIREHL